MRLWAVVVAMVGAGWGLEPMVAEEVKDESKAAKLRVMAWNIRHGEGEDRKLDLERVAGVIAQTKPDVVLLQEVDDRAERTRRVAQAEALAKLTGLKATFGKAMDFQGGGYGNAVLTRWEPLSSRVVPLPGGGEPRCALEVTLERPDGRGRFIVVSTHLDVSSGEMRTTHANQLAADLARRPELVILGGDFNATPDEPPMRAFGVPWLNAKKHGPNPATIPADQPRREIDFILLKPASGDQAPVVARHEVIEEKVASDHRPIVMEITLPVAP